MNEVNLGGAERAERVSPEDSAMPMAAQQKTSEQKNTRRRGRAFSNIRKGSAYSGSITTSQTLSWLRSSATAALTPSAVMLLIAASYSAL